MKSFPFSLGLTLPYLVNGATTAPPGQVDVGSTHFVTSFNAGGHHTCAVVDSYTAPSGVKCWGGGGSWLGLGDGHNRGDHKNEMGDDLPYVNVSDDELTVVQLALGRRHTCALFNDYNTVKCWGRSDHGVTGTSHDVGDSLSDMGDNLKPVDLGDGFIVQITAGGYHSCAVFGNGRVKCWGSNDHGQLGYGDKKDRGRNPNTMGNNLPFIDLGVDENNDPLEAYQVVSGLLHNCALFHTGQIKCWGYNKWGTLGLGHTHDRGTKASHMGDNLGFSMIYNVNFGVIHMTAGKYHTCVVDVWGYVTCWGYNANGELGEFDGEHIGDELGDMYEYYNAYGVLLPLTLEPFEGPDLAKVYAGYHHTCAVLSFGSVACWGDNEYGQLGIGHTENRGKDMDYMSYFLPLVNLPEDRYAIDLTVGEYHSCALLDNQLPYCWGRNHQGQLGLGDKENRGDEPGELPPNRNFNIELIFANPIANAMVEESFHKAAERWGELLTTDFIDVESGDEPLDLSYFCGPDAEVWLEPYHIIDDLLIVVNVGEIDGPGEILGYAGPCLFFPESSKNDAIVHPRAGIMRFDDADLEFMINSGTLDNVIMHEMGHVLGIGTLWQADFFPHDYSPDLVKYADSTDPRYRGKGGKFGLRKIHGSGLPKVEADGGEGTALGHWDEVEYDNELMTGYVEEGGVPMPLSALTAYSLTDLGHTLRKEHIDNFDVRSVTGDNRRRLRGKSTTAIKLIGDMKFSRDIQGKYAKFGTQFHPVSSFDKTGKKAPSSKSFHSPLKASLPKERRP